MIDYQKVEKLAYEILPVAYQETMLKEHVLFMIQKYHVANVIVEEQTENTIELIVQRENQMAVRFYEKYGYKIKEVISHTFENSHTLLGYLMYKKIVN